MRSKMLGLAIALSTFGLGVAATTLWIAYHTPPAPQEIVKTRTVFVDVPNTVYRADSAPCFSTKPVNADRFVLPADTLDGKAVSKYAPTYPQAARAAQMSGTVVVQVTVDECGSVIVSKPLSGPPLLQQAAAQAALKWRFKPTLVSGQPVKVSSTITFDFVL